MNQSIRLACILASALLCLPIAARAEDSQSPGPEYRSDLSVLLSSALESKLIFTETATLPVLKGQGLMAENNLQLKGGVEMAPVSVNGTVEAILTPIAFLQFNAGASVGTGWNIGIANGLCISTGEADGDRNLSQDPFEGMVWKVKGGAAFQADLAAFNPGAWHHIVFRTYHEFFYRGLSGYGEDTSWLYEADEGENRNGWNYYGNYLLGYQMPIFLNTIGFLIEENLYLYETPGRRNWGDDLPRWNFGPLADFKLSDWIHLTLLVQVKTERRFLNGTGDLEFYQAREVDSSNPYKLVFNRVAVTASFRLK